MVVGIVFLIRKSFGVMSTGQVVLSGVLWGALLLLQPVAIVVLPFWLLLLHLRSRCPRVQTLVLGVIPILIVAPWMVRDAVVFHSPVFIRDNFGLELAVSNNPCASALFEANDQSGCWALTHPNYSLDEATKVKRMGEVEYNRLKLRESIAWIRENLSQFATLTGQRMIAFWFPPRSLNKGNGIIWRPVVVQVFTLLSLPGWFLMWRNSRVAAYIVGLWLLFFPPIYYVIQFMDRYRYPIFWASFLSGSYFLVEIVRGLAGGRQEAELRDQVGAPNREVA